MRVIAKVEFTKAPEDWGRERWSRLRPYYHAEDGSWVEVPEEDRTSRFPSEGLVFWYDSPQATEETGSWWRLEVGTDREHEGKDQFEVGAAHQLYQLEEFGSLDEVELRRETAKGSLQLSTPPVGPVLVRIPETNRWVGPMEFQVAGSGGRSQGPADIPTGFLDVFEINDGDFENVTLGQRTVTVLKPSVNLSESKIDVWAAQDDEHLMTGLFKRLQQIDSSVTEAMDLSQGVFTSYLEKLSELGLTGEDARREEARLQAARSLMDRIELQHRLLEEAADSLASHPEVQREVQRRVDEQVNSQLEELDSRFNQAQEEREQEIQDLEERLAHYRSELSRRKDELDHFEHQAREKLEKVVRSILADPVEKLSEHLLVRALVSIKDAEGVKDSATVENVSAAEFQPGPPEGHVDSLKTLRGSAEVAARYGGFNPSLFLSGIAAILSRKPLFVTGDRALEFCEILSSMISAGCTYGVAVPSNLFSLDDLFELPAVPAGRSDAQVTRVGEVLLAAAESDHLVTLLFRGVNRSPLETSFVELLPSPDPETPPQSLPWKRKNRTTTPLVTVPVPRNIQIIATFAEGPSCFALPSQVAARSSVVDTNRGDRGEGDRSLRVPVGNITGDTRASIAEDARDVEIDGATVAMRDSLAPEFARVRELHTYQGVFADGVKGMVEWMVARLAPVEGLGGLRTRLDEAPEEVRTRIEQLTSSNGLDYISRLRWKG